MPYFPTSPDPVDTAGGTEFDPDVVVSRRRFLRGAAILGALTFSGLGGASAVAATKKTTKKTTKKAVTTTKAPATATGATFASTMEMSVVYTYDAMGKNPYVAVWVEDAKGDIVRTVDASLNLTHRGKRYIAKSVPRWLSEITGKSSDYIAAVSSATRVAGTYKLVWDGKNDAGAPVALGEYYVCLEAAQEHGGYEMIREKVTIANAASTKELTPQGSISSVTVKMHAKA